jgi:hypothetical protein
MHSVEYQFFIILAFNKVVGPLAFQALGPSRCLRAISNARGALHKTEPIANTRLRLIIQALFLV